MDKEYLDDLKIGDKTFNYCLYHHVTHWAAVVAMIVIQIAIGATVLTAEQNNYLSYTAILGIFLIGALSEYFLNRMITFGTVVAAAINCDIRKITTPAGGSIARNLVAAKVLTGILAGANASVLLLHAQKSLWIIGSTVVVIGLALTFIACKVGRTKEQEISLKAISGPQL